MRFLLLRRACIIRWWDWGLIQSTDKCMIEGKYFKRVIWLRLKAKVFIAGLNDLSSHRGAINIQMWVMMRRQSHIKCIQSVEQSSWVKNEKRGWERSSNPEHFRSAPEGLFSWLINLPLIFSVNCFGNEMSKNWEKFTTKCLFYLIN